MPTFSNRSALRNCSTSWNLWNWFHKSYKFGVIATLVEFEPGGFQFQENLANIFLTPGYIYRSFALSAGELVRSGATLVGTGKLSIPISRTRHPIAPGNVQNGRLWACFFGLRGCADQRLHRSDAEISRTF
jgi:hypothetical protein